MLDLAAQIDICKKMSLVDQTARRLAELSLQHEGGRYLGSEGDLLTRLNVSRPTLRQAARMVAHDRLIEVRRGSGGGFYASRPDAADSVRALANYLRLKNTSLADVMVVTGAVFEEAAALACGCSNEELRERLVGVIDREEPGSGRQAIKAETELAQIIAQMSGNAAIELTIAIGFTFGLEEREATMFASVEERRKAHLLQRAVVEAVLAGDPDIARLMARRRSAQLSEWMESLGSA